MGTCQRLNFPRKKVCAGDFRNPITIERRDLQTPDPLDDTPTIGFTVVASMRAAVKSVNYPQRIDGINTGEVITHELYVRYRPTLSIDFNNHFVRLRGQLLRVLRAGQVDGDRRLIKIQATDRGVDTKKAAEA